MAIRPTVDSDPGQYINIRLTNGTAFYTAGGTSVSGGGVLTADQGSPNLLANAWPFKLTDGSNVLATSANPAWVTGSITVTNPDSRTISGSITGLLVGGVPLASTNPLWVTGSVGVTNAPSSVTIISGSVSGLLVGGQPVSNANPVPTSQQGVITVTGSVKLSELASLPAIDQGSPNLVANGWPVKLTDGSNVLATSANPAWITGSVYVINPSGGAGGSVTAQSGSVTGLLVGGVALSNANPVPVGDAGGSLTVDGTVAVSSVGGTVTVAAHAITSGSITGLLVGGVNVANSNPVPISDAGGSVTVDGTVTAGQGTAAALSAPWPMILVSGSDPVGTTSHPMWVTGSVYVLNQTAGGPAAAITGSVSLTEVAAVTGTVVLGRAVDIATLPNVTVGNTVTVAAHAITSGSVTGLLVGGVAVSNANPVPMSDAGGSLTVDGTVAVSSVGGTVTTTSTVVSGSVSGLLVGGVPLSNANPVPISDAGGSITVDGTVSVGTPNVTVLSGSVSGLLLGGQPVSNANGIPITDAGGSITVDGTVAVSSVGGTVTVAAHSITSGSVTGLLVGGVNVSNANPVPISDAGGSLTVDGSVSITGTPTVTAAQGTAAAIDSPWPVIIVSGSDPVGTTSHPMWVTGSVYVINQGGAGSNVTALSGSVAGLLVGGVALSNANPIPISDAGGSITVDGTVSVGTPNVTVLSGSVSGLLLGGQPVSNANGIPITDAGGSLTVDGTVAVSSVGGTVTTSTTLVSGSVSGLLVGGVALSNANPVPISDAGGALTVDGTVAVSSVGGTVTANATVVSGSITGLLVGGVNVSNANPVPISDAGGAITVDGTVTANVASTVINSGSLTGLLVGGVPVAGSNPVPTKEIRSTATVTSLTASVTSQMLKASNTARLGLSVFNDSTSQMFLKYGSAATSNDYSVRLMPEDYLEVPYGYTGQVDALWFSATGSARITEFS